LIQREQATYGVKPMRQALEITAGSDSSLSTHP
jgi:hypothetical protein